MISNNTSTCQDCGGKLKYYDKVRRIVRTKGRVSKWVNVPRYQCSECGCIHRYLPDYIYPYKQYESEIIAGVIEGLITCETFGYEDYPCEMTMIRWKAHKSHMLLRSKDYRQQENIGKELTVMRIRLQKLRFNKMRTGA